MNSSASHPLATRIGPPAGSRRVSPRLTDKCSSSRKWAIAQRRSADAVDSASESESAFSPLSLVILIRAGRGVVA